MYSNLLGCLAALLVGSLLVVLLFCSVVLSLCCFFAVVQMRKIGELQTSRECK